MAKAESIERGTIDRKLMFKVAVPMLVVNWLLFAVFLINNFNHGFSEQAVGALILGYFTGLPCSILAFHPFLLPIAGAVNSFGWGYAVAASYSRPRR